MKRLNFLNHEISNIHAAALILGAAGFLSRLVGVLRNRLLFAEFGAGRELDIYYAAFQIPDFMAALFLLGAASAAILPIFQEYLLEEKKKAQEFIASLALVFFFGASLLSAAAFFAAPLAAPLVAPGFSSDEQALMVSVTRLMLISPILFGLSGIFSVVVQSFGLFFVYALAPILYNVGIIVGIAFLVPVFGIYGVGIGVVLGALAHLGLQFGASASRGFWPGIRPGSVWSVWSGTSNRMFAGRGIKKVLVLSFPRVLAISFSQMTGLVLVAIGSTLAAGSVAVFAAAQDLYFVPVGIFGVSYAVAIFPRLSRAAAAKSGAEYLKELALGIRAILFWTAPSAALFLVLRAHIVRVGLGAGAFSWEDTRLTAAVLAALAVAMVAAALQTLLVRGFYALGNTWIPLAVNFFSSLFSIALAFGAANFLGSDSELSRAIAGLFRIGDLPRPRVLGLGIGFAGGMVVNVAALAFLLVRRAERQFGAEFPRRTGEVSKIAIAALGAAAAAYLVRASFSETLPLITFMRVLVQGTAAAAAGLGTYWGMLSLMQSEDVAALRRSVARRLFSIGILPKSWDGDRIVTSN